jgi:hypothetical protein
MRRVEQQISRIRRETENEEFTDTTGIQDQEFIDALVDAQRDMQSAISRQHQNVFIAEDIQDIVGGQELYDLPDDILLNNRISNVWYSDTGRTRDNRRLRSGTLTERIFDRSNVPALYIRRSGKILLSPIPRSTIVNGLTVNYQQKIPDLDVRRAKIASVTLDTSTRTITSLTLDTTVDFQREELLEESYMCVVDPKGDQQMSRIEFTDIDNTTGVVTVSGSFVYKEGETAQADWYVVRGYNTTNKCELPDTCERYLISYGEWVMNKRDSSADSGESAQELYAIRDEIVESFKKVDDDVKHITIDDTQFIDDDDLWVST